jgi:hypothetical protein
MLTEDYICHHGIKGQRWGVRRFQPYSKGQKKGKTVGKASRASKRQRKEEAIISDRQQALQNRRHLSNDELRRRINRLRMEEDFKNLSKRDLDTGKKRSNKVLSAIGNKATAVVAAAVTGAAIYAIRQAILKKPGNPEDFVNAVLPMGGKKKK